MIMAVHRLSPQIETDMAATRDRIRASTIAAEDVLHDLGAIAIMSSDSQGMGRIGEVISRTWQLAHRMKELRGGGFDVEIRSGRRQPSCAAVSGQVHAQSGHRAWVGASGRQSGTWQAGRHRPVASGLFWRQAAGRDQRRLRGLGGRRGWRRVNSLQPAAHLSSDVRRARLDSILDLAQFRVATGALQWIRRSIWTSAAGGCGREHAPDIQGRHALQHRIAAGSTSIPTRSTSRSTETSSTPRRPKACPSPSATSWRERVSSVGRCSRHANRISARSASVSVILFFSSGGRSSWVTDGSASRRTCEAFNGTTSRSSIRTRHGFRSQKVQCRWRNWSRVVCDCEPPARFRR